MGAEDVVSAAQHRTREGHLPGTDDGAVGSRGERERADRRKTLVPLVHKRLHLGGSSRSDALVAGGNNQPPRWHAPALRPPRPCSKPHQKPRQTVDWPPPGPRGSLHRECTPPCPPPP